MLKWHETIPNGGLILFRGAFNDDRLSITTPEALKAILSDHSYDYEKPKLVREFLSQILGHGLLMVEGNEHKFQRKHLTAAFTVKQIRNLYPAFWDKSRLMVDQIEAQIAESGNTVVELNDWATRATLDIIGTAGLGRDFGALRNPDDELVQKYNTLLEPSKENGIYFALSVLLGKSIVRLIPWRLHGELQRLVKDLNDYALSVVHERQAELASLEKRGMKSEEKDILTLLVQSGDFKDTELADQFLTFIAAG
jgi:cytochrome P450